MKDANMGFFTDAQINAMSNGQGNNVSQIPPLAPLPFDCFNSIPPSPLVPKPTGAYNNVDNLQTIASSMQLHSFSPTSAAHLDSANVSFNHSIPADKGDISSILSSSGLNDNINSNANINTHNLDTNKVNTVDSRTNSSTTTTMNGNPQTLNSSANSSKEVKLNPFSKAGTMKVGDNSAAEDNNFKALTIFNSKLVFVIIVVVAILFILFILPSIKRKRNESREVDSNFNNILSKYRYGYNDDTADNTTVSSTDNGQSSTIADDINSHTEESTNNSDNVLAQTYAVSKDTLLDINEVNGYNLSELPKHLTAIDDELELVKYTKGVEVYSSGRINFYVDFVSEVLNESFHYTITPDVYEYINEKGVLPFRFRRYNDDKDKIYYVDIYLVDNWKEFLEFK